uniref:Uncharacterized protein n=1 Tax=Zea mays TaxID=4577 RepID=A0A804QGN0_MAIZE
MERKALTTKFRKRAPTCAKLPMTPSNAALACTPCPPSNLQILGPSFPNIPMAPGPGPAPSTALAKHAAAPPCTALLCSPITSNSGFTNSITVALPASATPEADRGRRYTAASWPATSRHASRTEVSDAGSLSRRARWASTLWRCGAAASGCDAQSVARRRRDSRLAGEANPGESDASALSSMGTASVNGGARMMRSSSSTAMWCVSRSESLASAASTRDLSSTIAAFFDGVAPAAADNGGGGGGAAPTPADAAFEPGFGGGCAVVGDLGWDLTADLESAVAIAMGVWSMQRRVEGEEREWRGQI